MAVTRLQNFSEVGSLDLTWWPDLLWLGPKNYQKSWGRVARTALQAPPFFRYREKTSGGRGVETPPPCWARVKPPKNSSEFVLIVHLWMGPKQIHWARLDLGGGVKEMFACSRDMARTLARSLRPPLVVSVSFSASSFRFLYEGG